MLFGVQWSSQMDKQCFSLCFHDKTNVLNGSVAQVSFSSNVNDL